MTIKQLRFLRAVALFSLITGIGISSLSARGVIETGTGETPTSVGTVDLSDGEKLRVVATTSILGDVVANILDDDVELMVLIPLGQDPHGFEATPSTMSALESAHIVFTNGFGLEESLLGSIDSVATGTVINTSEGVDEMHASEEIHGDEHDDDHEDEHADDHEDEHDDDHEDEHARHDHSAGDPHVWFDPQNVIVWVENIEKALASANPASRAVYRSRAESYIDELMELDSWIESVLEVLPAERRKVVTDHDSFGHFAEAYGFEIVGTVVPDTTTTTDMSVRALSRLVDVLRDEGVETMFLGETAGRDLEKLARTVAGELGEEVQIVELFTGSLARSGQPGDTYLEYMRVNTERIVEGLSR